MSTTDKRPYHVVLPLAQRILDKLAPACHRIELAGSLRRQAEHVGDIELIAVPRPHHNLLGEETAATFVDDLLFAWRDSGHVTIVKSGEKYKQFHFNSTAGRQYLVDLFLQPDPQTWGVNFMIRTGPAEFSKRMVTAHSAGGLRPDQYQVRDARVWEGGTALETPEEEDVFRLWGMNWIPPQERDKELEVIR